MSELFSCCLSAGCLSATPCSDGSLGHHWHPEGGSHWHPHCLPPVSVPNSPGRRLHSFPSEDQAAPPATFLPAASGHALCYSSQLPGAPLRWPFPTSWQGKAKDRKNMWELGFIYATGKNNLISLCLNFLLKYSLFTMIQGYSKVIVSYIIYMCVCVCIHIYIYTYRFLFRFFSIIG